MLQSTISVLKGILLSIGLMITLSGCQPQNSQEVSGKNDQQPSYSETVDTNEQAFNISTYNYEDVLIDGMLFQNSNPTYITLDIAEKPVVHTDLWHNGVCLGFAIYKVNGVTVDKLLASVSTVTTACDRLIDENHDGVMDGFYGYAHPNSMEDFVVRTYHSWSMNGDTILEETLDLGSIPRKPEEALRYYYLLELLDDGYGPHKLIDERIAEMNPNGLSVSHETIKEVFNNPETRDQMVFEYIDSNYEDYVIVSNTQEDGSLKSLARVTMSDVRSGNWKLLSYEVPCDLEKDNASFSEDTMIVTVNNASELIYHMAANKTFKLMPGDYDFSHVDEGLNLKHFSRGFFNLSNVIIEGADTVRVKIITEDYNQTTLSIRASQNVVLNNLELGHDPAIGYPGSCAAGVLTLNDVDTITIENCDLFGCGTIALHAYKVDNMLCKDSVFRDCSDELTYLWSSRDLLFDNCIFEKSNEGDVTIYESDSVQFINSNFVGDNRGYPQVVVDEEPIFAIDIDGTKNSIDTYEHKGVVINNCIVQGDTVERIIESIIFDGIEGEVEIRYVGYGELDYEFYFNADLNIPEGLAKDELLNYLYVIGNRIEENYQAAALTRDAIAQIEWYNVNIKYETTEDPWYINLYQGGHFRIDSEDVDMNLLAQSTDFIGVDDAIDALARKLELIYTVDHKQVDDLTVPIENIQYNGIYYDDGIPYYYFSIDDEPISYNNIFYIRARDGQMSFYVHDERVSDFVEPSETMRIKVFEQFIEDNSNYLDNYGTIENYTMYQSGDYIIVYFDGYFEWKTIYKIIENSETHGIIIEQNYEYYGC